MYTIPFQTLSISFIIILLKVQWRWFWEFKLMLKCHCACSSKTGTCLINDAWRQTALKKNPKNTHTKNKTTKIHVIWSNLSKRRFIYMFWRFILYKRCSVRLYLQLFVGGLLSYLRYLCLFVFSVVPHILCCVFALYFFVLKTKQRKYTLFDRISPNDVLYTCFEGLY
jgi:hypothetical protein